MPDETRIAVLVLCPVPPRPRRRPDLEAFIELRRLADDLHTEGITLIPCGTWPPWYPPFSHFDIDEFEELLKRGRFDWPAFDYWWHRWVRDWRESTERWEYYPEYLHETLDGVQRLIERRLVSGVVLVTSGFAGEPMKYELQQIFELLPPRAILHLEIGRPEREAGVRLRSAAPADGPDTFLDEGIHKNAEELNEELDTMLQNAVTDRGDR